MVDDFKSGAAFNKNRGIEDDAGKSKKKLVLHLFWFQFPPCPHVLFSGGVKLYILFGHLSASVRIT
jgi:hypothetical protein